MLANNTEPRLSIAQICERLDLMQIRYTVSFVNVTRAVHTRTRAPQLLVTEAAAESPLFPGLHRSRLRRGGLRHSGCSLLYYCHRE